MSDPNAQQPQQPSQGQPGQQQSQPGQYGAPQYQQPVYQQPQYPVQPQYAQPQYAYGVPAYAPPPPRGLSITSMVLGLASFVFGFTFAVPLVGLILGIIALKREPAGRAMSLTGIIVSAVMLLAWVAVVFFFILFAIGVFGTAATYSYRTS